MNLFRSEEHITRWLAGRQAGVTISSAKLSDLAHAWWGDRITPSWQPRSLEENQAILTQLELTGTFWGLA